MINTVTLLLVIALSVLLSKHRKKRRYNLRRVRLTPELALGTLASDTVLDIASVAVATEPYRCVTMKNTWTLIGLTGGEGPITVGYAHADYTTTEVKECLESFASVSRQDKIANERANRLVRIVGTFQSIGSSILNDGRPIKTRLNWWIGIGQTVRVFAYNEGTGTLTTGAAIKVAGDMWVKDSV